MRIRELSGLLALQLAACTDSETPTPAPNLAPVFTSALTASVVENATGPAYLATATDPENDPLTFTIGGVDAARFTISSGGAVQFVSPPNFEAPTDANKDNIYAIELAASDGKDTTKQQVEIKVTNSTEGISVRRVATGLTDLVTIAAVPGDPSRLFLVRMTSIYLFDPATNTQTLLTALLPEPPPFPPMPPFPPPSFDLRSINSFVPAPDYQTSHGFYMGIFKPNEPHLAYYEPRPNGSFQYFGVRGFSNKHPQRVFGIGPDKKVYIHSPSSDGISGGTPDNSSAAIERLGRLSSAGGFSPAAGNPYLGGAGGGTSNVFDYGIGEIRGPIAFHNGYMLFLSEGRELNMASITEGGFSFGWPYFVGTTRQREGGPANMVGPVMILPEDSDGIGAVIATFVYTGPITSLSGKYVFITASGKMRTIDMSLLVPGTLAPTQVEARENDMAPDIGTLNSLMAATKDDSGSVWLLKQTGELYVMRPE